MNVIREIQYKGFTIQKVSWWLTREAVRCGRGYRTNWSVTKTAYVVKNAPEDTHNLFGSSDFLWGIKARIDLYLAYQAGDEDLAKEITKEADWRASSRTDFVNW